MFLLHFDVTVNGSLPDHNVNAFDNAVLTIETEGHWSSKRLWHSERA